MSRRLAIKEWVHPWGKERIRSFLANSSFLYLLFLFLLLLAISSAIGAFYGFLNNLSHGQYDFYQLFWNYVSFYLQGDFKGGYELGVGTLLYRLMLKTFLLGGIVYKLLLTSDLFRFRRRFSSYWDDARETWYIAIRPYNASRMDILDVQFKAILRIPTRRNGNRVLPNEALKIEPPKHFWLYSMPLVPYTVPIRLHDGDVEIVSGEPELRSIQGHNISPNESDRKHDSDGESFLVITATGQVPRLGRTVIQSQWYRLTTHHGRAEYDWGKPVAVQTVPGKKPRKTGGWSVLWERWRQFETTRSYPVIGYVFAYGSLVNPEDYGILRAKFQLEQPDAEPYCLEGYRRIWDVAMNNTETISGYKHYAEAAGNYEDIFVAFADIAPSPGSRVHGVLIPVNQPLLDHLDRRERNYKRELVARYSRNSTGEPLTVWAYIGSDAGKSRFRTGVTEQRVYVARDYRERIVQAYAARELSAPFEEEDAAFDLELRDLTRVDIPSKNKQDTHS